MPPANQLYLVARDVLTFVEDTFATAGVLLPERRFVANGEVAFDCPQVTVRLLRAYVGNPGEESAEPLGPSRCATPRAAEYEILITRCVPVPNEQGKPPGESELQGSAEEILQDAWVLWDGLLVGFLDGTLPTLDTCGQVRVNPVTTVGPEGGHGGSLTSIEVQV